MKPLSMSEQLIAMSKENDALVEENRRLRLAAAWQTIESVPDATNVLLWWTPVDGNKNAEAPVIGHVSIFERGKFWNGQTGTYEDLSRITHWMPLPEPPQ